jgi:YfiH family protein
MQHPDITSKTLNINSKGDMIYFTFPSLEELSFVKHGFSSKLGGVSSGIFESLNLSIGRGDSEENVLQNFRIFCDGIDVDFRDLVFSSQSHSKNIRVASLNDKGKGLSKARDYSDVDGLVTNVSGIPLLTSYADCVPLFFADPVKKAVGVVHSGWRGTVQKIGTEAVASFVNEYGSDPSNIIACIGPSICKNCFEVDKDVMLEFRNIQIDFSSENPLSIEKYIEHHISSLGINKYNIDLWKINENILIEAGIRRGNITVGDLCTNCRDDIFYSQRAMGDERGSLAAVIEMR